MSRSTGITTRCPHRLLRQKVWARATEKTVEIFHDGQRVAAHLRSPPDRRHTTLRDHMPSSHRRYADWTPEKIRREAAEIGPGDGGAGRRDPERAQPPRAGLPLLPRHPAAGPDPRARTARGRLPTRARDRRALLHLGQLDPEDPPRSPAARPCRGRAGDLASQHPRRRLLPLKERPCSPIRPSTSCERSSSTAWRTPSPNSRRRTAPTT